MGPKYEFTGETMNYDGHVLHRIRRLSDGQRGGWIEKEENLSQEGKCWLYYNANVYYDPKVFGNAKIYDNAEVYGQAHIYDNARVYGDAEVFGNAKVYGNAEVCINTKVYGKAKIHGDALVHDIEISSGEYTSGEYFNSNYINQKPLANPITEVVQDFIYKIDDSNKLTTQTEYDSIDEFFNEPITKDVKLDTLVICTIDTKEPLIKLQKVETKDKTEFKFIVDIVNEDSDNFMFKSIIKSQDQLDQLIQQTVEALRLYPKFSKYADDLEDYL